MVHDPTTTNEPRVNVTELTVSELSMALKRTIEDAYDYVRVRGELGKVSYHSNGHVYFDLKDEDACISGVIWRRTSARIKLRLETGLEVVVTGRVTTYPGQSKYQIVVDSLEPAGVGALMALVEERKKKLAAEGLFDAARKQLLPFLPRVVGVVTSPTGAVIRDILHRLADRFPRHVLLWPVRVQGEGSAAEVAAAIRGFNELPEHGPILRPDLLIVARGGGSLEDLWSFNEEIVVRAAAESMIPLISAVGHETDVTLIDFAADKRAPTPTAAAEMAVPVRTELLLQVDGLARRALACWQRGQEARRTELRAATRALPSADELFALARQRLDHAAALLPRALTANAQVHHRQFLAIAGRVSLPTLRGLIERRRERYHAVAQRLDGGRIAYVEARRAQIGRARDRILALSERGTRAMATGLENRLGRLERARRLLAAVSYRGVLERGFALVRDLAGQPLRSAAALSPGAKIEIEFADGCVRARTEDGAAPSAVPAENDGAKPRRRGGGGNPGQGSLFGA